MQGNITRLPVRNSVWTVARFAELRSLIDDDVALSEAMEKALSIWLLIKVVECHGRQYRGCINIDDITMFETNKSRDSISTFSLIPTELK